MLRTQGLTYSPHTIEDGQMGIVITTRGQMSKGGSEKVYLYSRSHSPGMAEPESIPGSVFAPELMCL